MDRRSARSQLELRALEILAAPNLRTARRLAGSKPDPPLAEALFQAFARLMGAQPDQALAWSRRHRVWADLGAPALACRVRAGADLLRGRYGSAAQWFARAASHADTPEAAAAHRIGEVDALARAGRPGEGIELAQALLPLVKGFQRGRLLLNLGNALAWADRLPEAEPTYADAARSLGLAPVLRAAAWLGRSTALVFGERPAGGALWAERARKVFLKADLPAYAALADGNLAYAELLQGRPDQAYLRLMRMDREGLSGADRARLSFFQGEAALALNLPDTARNHFLDADPKSLPPLNRADLAYNLFLLGDLGSLKSAIEGYRRAGNPVWTAVAEAHVAKRQATALDVLRREGACYQLALALLRDPTASHLEEAARLVHRGGYRGLRWRIAYERGLRQTKGLRWFRVALREMSDLRNGVQSAAARTAFYADKQAALRTILERLLAQGRVEEALRAVASTRAVTLFEEIVSAQGLDPNLAVKAASLANAESDSGTRQGRTARAPTLPDLTCLPRSVSPGSDGQGATFVFGEGLWSLGKEVQRWDSGPDRIEREAAWARFEVVSGASGRSVHTLRERFDVAAHGVLCLDGPLWSLPWHAMFPDRPLAFRFHPGNPTHDPELPPDPKVAIWAGVFEDLPWVEREVEWLLQRYPQARVCRSAAEVKASWEEPCDLVHVATHASFHPESGMWSSLRFPDGEVFALEIARSGFRTQLAVLQACETGALDARISNEPQGLVRAFLACGARAVAASLWPLDDQASYVATQALYGSLGRVPLPQALHDARLAVRQAKESPYHWAGLALYYGYA